MTYNPSDVRDVETALDQYYISKYKDYLFTITKIFCTLNYITIRTGLYSSSSDLLIKIHFDPIDKSFYRSINIKVSYLTIARFNRTELLEFLNTLIDGQILKLEPFVPTDLAKELYY